MFRNYLKTAIKSLFRNKFFSIVNIIGLAMGITVSLLILMYIVNELSYENFQKNRQNIYRVALEWGTEGNIMKFAGSMPALAPAMNLQIPEIELAIRIRKDYDAVLKRKDGQEFKENNLFFADSGVFKVFSFGLKEGNPSDILTDPFSVVISENIATKYFGKSDPLGQELLYQDIPLKITGIMDDIPENTHLKCDFLVSYSTLKAIGKTAEMPWNQWGDDLTYILLKDKVSVNSILPKLNELLKNNAGEWLASRMKFVIQPLKEIHWETDTRGDIGAKGNKAYVYIFLFAAILVLLIACFNYLNLAVSQYLGRIKEVGIRKTAGAQKKHLILQFIIESMLVILISAIIGIYLFEELYKSLYSYLGTTFVLTESHVITLFLIVLIIIFLVGATAGLYPAFFISKFNPIEILRKETFGLYRKLTFRKILIIFQFFISIILLVGTIVLFLQTDYMKNSDLGFNKKNVILAIFPGLDPEVNKKYEVLKDELLKNPDILSISGAYTVPGINSQMNFGVKPEGAPDGTSVNIQALPSDYGFVKSLGLEIINGRDFSKEFSTDRYESVLLNQTAVATLGLDNPIGIKLQIPGDDFKKGVNVIGVVRDFHLQSFHNKINPMLIYINPQMYICIAIRINPHKMTETLEYLKSACDSVLPGINMNYRFLEDAYETLYISEKKTGQLLSVFTALALFISCLGLYGFVTFMVCRRTKEVGIRKVMGAKVAGIAFLFSGQFAVLAVVSSVIACPVAYILAAKWLKLYAFHINIEWWIFAAAIIIEMIIILLTVSWQSWRAATRNPVDSLRYE
jgi:putative ABC transport system permease protein